MFIKRYGQSFQRSIKMGSVSSAEQVVPLVLALTGARTVLDLGCGTGAWLSVFARHGLDEVVGVDGSYIDTGELLIPEERFIAHDLRQRLQLDRRFDLATSLEVAEHIPAPFADAYVDSLAAHSDTILFSAAVPGQGGIGHVNEQWPEYWRDRFAARGFVLIDCLRHRVWSDPRVERWYRQNLLLFVRPPVLEGNERLRRERELSQRQILSVVHPEAAATRPLRQIAFERLASYLTRGA